MTNYADQYWEMLRLSRDAIDLGARPNIVTKLTGMTEAEMARIFFTHKERRRVIGGPPTSPQWVIGKTINHLHAAYFYRIFSRLRALGNRSPESLITAYRIYWERFSHDPRLTFDRAYYLVGHITGLWIKGAPQLESVPCASCGALHIRLRGGDPVTRCTFCDLARRYWRNTKMRRALGTPLDDCLDALVANSTRRRSGATGRSPDAKGWH